MRTTGTSPSESPVSPSSSSSTSRLVGFLELLKGVGRDRVLLDRVQDLARGRDHGVDLEARSDLGLVDRLDVERVGHREDQPAVVEADRDDTRAGAPSATAAARPQHGRSRTAARLTCAQALLLGQRRRDLFLGRRRDPRTSTSPSLPTVLCLLGERALKLLVGDESARTSSSPIFSRV